MSFLITNFHTEVRFVFALSQLMSLPQEMLKNKLVDFVVHFMQEIDSEVSSMKLDVNSRARVVASTFLSQVLFLSFSLSLLFSPLLLLFIAFFSSSESFERK